MRLNLNFDSQLRFFIININVLLNYKYEINICVVRGVRGWVWVEFDQTQNQFK